MIIDNSQGKNLEKNNIRAVIKNIKSKEDINQGISPDDSVKRGSDQDYSAYLENEQLAHQSSYEDPSVNQEIRLMSQKEKNKLKQKRNLKFNEFGLKPEGSSKHKGSVISSQYRANSSQANDYEQDIVPSNDVSDLSEEYIHPRKPKMVSEDRRRVHTEFDRHPVAHKVYGLNPSKKFKHEAIKASMKGKIGYKIKNRRKSEIDYYAHDSFYNQDELGVDIAEANKNTHYQDEDSSNPDLQEGRLYSNNLTTVEEELKQYGREFYNQPPPQYYEDLSDDLEVPSSQERLETPGSDFIEDLNSDGMNAIDEDEFYAFNYSNEYIKKLESEIKSFHKKNIFLRNEIQTMFENFYKELNDLSDWKKNAKTKLKNYKIAIQELMRQIEEIKTKNAETVTLLKQKYSEAKNEKAKILQEYHSAQIEWENEHNAELEGLRSEFAEVLANKEEEFQRQVISNEGQIEDMMREIERLRDEKSSIVKKWKIDKETILRVDLEVAVKGCLEDILTIVVLKDEAHRRETRIRELERENGVLRTKASKSPRKVISISKIKRKNVLDHSGVTEGSQKTKIKTKGINISFKTNLGKKLNINGTRPKDIGNLSVIEKKNVSLSRVVNPADISSELETTLEKHFSDLDALKFKRDTLKREMLQYNKEYTSFYHTPPTIENDPKSKQMMTDLENLSSKISALESQISNLQSKSRSVSPKPFQIPSKNPKASKREISPYKGDSFFS